MDRPAVFLDRDGTLIEDVHYLQHPDQVRVLPGAIEAVRRWNDAGIPVIVVTNQSGVARGYYSEASIHAVHEHLSTLFANEGARVDAYYYCPHHPEGVIEDFRQDCECRKPKPGMLMRAAYEWKIDLQRSWIFGDQESDIRAGESVGCRTLWIRTAKPGAWIREPSGLPEDCKVNSLLAGWDLWHRAWSSDSIRPTF